MSFSNDNRKVTRIVLNPLVDNALESFDAENSIKLWDIAKGKIGTITGPKCQFFDINWSQDGNKLVLPSQDKRFNGYDPRTGAEIFSLLGHSGPNASRAVFYDKLNYIASTGFDTSDARELIVRDSRNPENPLHVDHIDGNPGILIPFIDGDLGLVYSPSKYVVNTARGEIGRFSVITQCNTLITLPMIMPRGNEEDTFQEGLYPPTIGPDPSIGFDAWKSGTDAIPKTVSLEARPAPMQQKLLMMLTHWLIVMFFGKHCT
jgi:hypothetical protein